MAWQDQTLGGGGRWDRAAQLIQLIESDPAIMEMLRAGRDLGLEKWCIAAGVIRNRVWDALHGFQDRTKPSDIDLLFYDRVRIEAAYEKQIEQRLGRVVDGVRWEAVNQATVHLYTHEAQYGSIEEAMSRWAESVTAVGVWLNDKNELTVIAPLGLEDLFGLVVRPNLVAPHGERVYRERMIEKRWMERWLKLRIIWPGSGA